MDTDQDYYSILGVSEDASQDEIKAAFKEKAREHHPDQSDDPDAEEKFKKISEAYEVLSDEQTRRQYDRYGKDGVDQSKRRRRQPGDLRDLIEEVFGAEFGDLFGGSGRGGGRRRQGADLKADLAVDFETAVRGGTKTVTLTKPEPCGRCDGQGATTNNPKRCPTCRGQGAVVQGRGLMQQKRRCPDCQGSGIAAADRCSDCDGKGLVNEEQTIEVDVPGGVSTGDHLTIEGEGQPVANGRDGRLVFEITVEPHPDFERREQDLVTTKRIRFDQAALGDTVSVETLDGGTVTVTVEPGTQHGDIARIDGRGVQSGRTQGDLIVEFQLQTPSELNNEQRQALQDFARAGGHDPDTQLVESNGLFALILSWIVQLGLYNPDTSASTQ